MGYTPQVLTGVWSGRDIPTPMGRSETGAHAALPTWLEAMQTFEQDRPILNFAPPEGVEWVAIDPDTGMLPGPETRKPFLESFRIGTAPSQSNPDGPAEPGSTEKKKDFFDMGL